MKNVKKLFQITLLALGLGSFQNTRAQAISSHFFGQNAWMPDTIGTVFLNGKLYQNWANIKDSKASIMRFGGISPDENMPTNFQYIKMIDAMRANGMEPVMQVPFYKNRYTAQQAATIVHYVNVTMGRNVKYWVIGNEPDLAYSFTSASQVAAYIKPYASAMKAIDPGILTIGPECAWYNQNIINGLTTPNGPDDITGKDANGRFYVDIISFHFYGFNGTQTRAEVISKINSPNQLQANLTALNVRLNTCNAAHNRSGASTLKTAITEANVNYINDASDNLSGVGANSFVGGQFIAEMMATGMKNSVDFINLWSVVEGNNNQLNIGYIDAVTGNKKPSFYHFKMLAENFSGNFLSGTTNQANVKAFASKNAQNTTVMLLNQDLTNNYNFTVRLNTVAVSGASALKININAGIAIEYNAVIPSQSSMLLVFNSQGVLIKKMEYSLTTHALANLPPTVTNYTAGNVTTSVNANDGEVASIKGFELNLFPNPANSKFTIEIDRRNPEEHKFQIELFDIMGRLISTQITTFSDRKQEVDFSGNSLAEGVYIVRVYETSDKDNVQSQKIILFK